MRSLRPFLGQEPAEGLASDADVPREHQTVELRLHEVRKHEAAAVNESFQSSERPYEIRERAVCSHLRDISWQVDIELFDLSDIQLEHLSKLDEVLLARDAHRFERAAVGADQVGHLDLRVLQSQSLQLTFLLQSEPRMAGL